MNHSSQTTGKNARKCGMRGNASAGKDISAREPWGYEETVPPVLREGTEQRVGGLEELVQEHRGLVRVGGKPAADEGGGFGTMMAG